MEEKIYEKVCQEANRELIVGNKHFGWTQINRSTDYEGREKVSVTTQMFPFRNILYMEIKMFSGDGHKNKLTELKLYDHDKKRITTIDMNESSGKALKHLINNYNSYTDL